MRNLNPYYLGIFLFLFCLTACEDNYVIEEEPTIEISEPENVSVARITGIVEDLEDQAVAGAEVVFSHNNAIHSTFTDQDGSYILELPADESNILIQVHADEYLTSGLNPVSLNEGLSEKNITLMRDGQTDYTGEIGLLELNSTANLSGTVLLANGNLAEDIVVFLVDLSTLLFSSYTVTDANGEYSIASEPFQNYALVALNACNDVGLIADNIILEDQDINFGEYQSEYVEVLNFTVSGFVTNCYTNEGLAGGMVEVTLEGVNQRFEGEIIDGEYSVIVDNCSSASCYSMVISSPLILSEILEIECQDIESENITADYTLCGEEFNLEGEIRIQIGSDSLIFDNATAGIDDTTGDRILFGFSEEIGLQFLATTKVDAVGLFGIEYLAIGEGNLVSYSNFPNSGLPFELNVLEFEEYMKGTMTGQVVGPNGNILPLSGTFDLQL